MQTNTLIKWLVLVIVIALSLYLVVPLGKKINLGLDLKGGYSFTLELDEDAIKESIKNQSADDLSEEQLQEQFKQVMNNAGDVAVEIIRNRIDALGTSEPVITRGATRNADGSKRERIYVQIPGISDKERDRAEKLVRSAAFLEFRVVHDKSDEESAKLLSGLKVGSVINGFVVVEEGGQKYLKRQKDFTEDLSAGTLAGFSKHKDFIFMMQRVDRDSKQSGKSVGTDLFVPCLVERHPKLTGSSISSATSQMDPMTGQNEVSLSFNSVGTKKFGEITTKNVNKKLAIILNGQVYSAPVIRTPIRDGRASISGAFTVEQAKQLSTVLKAGSMPAPLKFIGKRFVSPTLGEDSIANAKKAAIIGMVAILAFLIIYYRFMGVAASIALILNIVLLPLCMIITSGFLGTFAKEATMSAKSIADLPVLTLPGIAGIILTIGMAIDANILIYERTREEQQRGRPAFASILAGYDRAFLAIFDSNLTSVIIGVILFIFGTGLIKGFAITFIAGIVASMYTALVVTKMIFKVTVPETRAKPMSLMQLVKPDININFVGNAKKMIIIAVAIIVVTNAVTIVRGLRDTTSIFAVDFTGGAKITYNVGDKEKAPIADIRNVLANAGIQNVSPQYQSDFENKALTFLEIKTVMTEFEGQEISDVITSVLNEKMPEANISRLDVDSVGAQIGKEMRRSAFWAILFSCIAMSIYIAVRFEFGFAIGVFVSLIHNVLITIGIFACLGLQFNLTILAALLTVVGYGINDTIVLFDRIREELKHDQKSGYRELTNRCINVVLSRTLLTSLTTLLPIAALIVFTSGDIFGFSVCMFIGVIVSTFSSIFIASSTMLAWYKNKRPVFAKS